DQIDNDWRDRECWLKGGLRAYELAISLRDDNRLDLTVALAFSLQSGEQPRGVDFTTSLELASEFDWSPPSLYLFRRGSEPWVETIPHVGSRTYSSVIKYLDASKLFGASLRIE